MADGPSDSFEVVGDADDLPDAFFDALAALLLDLGGHDEPEDEDAGDTE